MPARDDVLHYRKEDVREELDDLRRSDPARAGKKRKPPADVKPSQWAMPKKAAPKAGAGSAKSRLLKKLGGSKRKF